MSGFRHGFDNVNFFQPENHCELDDHQHERHIKNNLVADFFVKRAADENRRRIGNRPSDVVDADGARGVRAFADERLQHRPGETHANVHDARGGDGSGYKM